jgi:hypothetical protein
MQIRDTDRIELRLQAVKAAAGMTSGTEDTRNLLIHARWLEEHILTGKSPAEGVVASESST